MTLFISSRAYFLALLLLPIAAFSQKITTQTDFQITAKKATNAIKIDGILDESDWQKAAIATGFQIHYPQNGGTPLKQTEVKVSYDDHFLYVGFVSYDSGKHVVQTLKRDVDFWSSDAVAVLIDPIGQQASGFFFGLNTEGVQSEALLSAGDDDMQFEWDNKWYAEVQQGVDRWTAEFAIPFKTLRYDPAKTAWNINFIRSHVKAGTWHTWTKIPLPFDGISLAHTGTLNWDAPPPSEKSNIALIPYATANVSKDYQSGKNTEGGANAGLDAKVALSSSLNMDITANSDFSQVEVDEQVTNLTRFNIFYPEKRTFFLENSDVLTQFGLPPARPFFSRTIGLNAQAQPVPILLYGVRMSGNVSKSVRVNAFNMHTKEKGTNLGQNFSAAAVQKNFWGRSYFKAGFLNRQGFTGFKSEKLDYGRNAILSLNVRTPDNRLETWLEGNHSFKDKISNKNNMFSTGFFWNGTRWQILTDWTHIGENFYADMGFINRIENYDARRDTIIRLGFTQNFTEINYTVRPKEGKVAEYQGGLENFTVLNTNGSLNEWFNRARYFITYRNTSELKFRIDNNAVNLPFSFSFSDENALLEPQFYYYIYGVLQFNSDSRKTFSWTSRLTLGQFYNGKRTGLEASANYRIQPWGKFSLKAEWNRISLPPVKGYDGITTLLLLSPKTEINFNRNMFWTTWFQYNTQSNNVNINSRFQWRYKPMSDVFLVYTDNYFAQDETIDLQRFRAFQTKNKALVLKLSYWLNL